MESEPPKAEPPKRKRRWFQFSLRTLLEVVTVAALLCAVAGKWRAVRERREADYQRAKRAIQDGGGVRPVIGGRLEVDPADQPDRLPQPLLQTLETFDGILPEMQRCVG